jgi:hypothetical protein
MCQFLIKFIIQLAPKMKTYAHKAWWLTPIILATQEVDIRRIMIGGQPGPKLARLHFLDGTGEHHSERGQPGPEDQKSYVLPYMWTLDLGQIEQCCWTWIIRQEENKDGT